MSQSTCPICNKDVDPLRARAMGIFGGTQYYFCSPECKAKFADPRRTPRDENGAAAPAAKPPALPPDPATPRAKDSPAKRAKAAAADVRARAEAEPPPAPDDAPGSEARAKRDPTPSVIEDVRAIQGGAGRVWGLVLALFAAAGVVLFFALK